MFSHTFSSQGFFLPVKQRKKKKKKTYLFFNLLFQLRLQHAVQETPLGIAVEQRNNHFPLLNGRKRLVVAQLAREQQIHVLFPVLAQACKQAATAARAQRHARNLYLVHLLALRDGDGEAFWVSETQAYAVDD